jgi:Ca2+-binding RTX toxin-like protein
MMAITPAFLDGRLDIVGDAANDTVVISTVNVGGVPHVTVNGLGVGSGVPAAAVTSIVADLGAGNDIMNLSTLSLGVFSGLTNGSVTLRGGVGNDNLTGTSLADTLIGGDNNDILVGGAGDDTIDAGNANDTLDGGAGDDQLIGGNGIDSYRYTGSGSLGSDTLVESPTDNFDDTLHFAGLGGPVTVDLAVTTPQEIRPGLLTITLSGGTAFERIEGTGFADVLYGNSRNNYINGANGNDLIWGRDGADNLLGGAGDDSIYGEAGNDIINGNQGNDLLFGGEGNDDLTGFTGSDSLAGGAGADTYTFTTSGAGGLDTIDDAVGGGEDRFNVAGLALTTFPDFDSTAIQSITSLQSIQFVTAGAVEWFLGGSANVQANSGLSGEGLYTVPGAEGTTTLVEFKYGGAIAGYNNKIYVFDATDPVNRYAARPVSEYLFAGNATASGTTKPLPFKAGTKLGFFIEQDGSANTLFFSEDGRNDNDSVADSNRNHVQAFGSPLGGVQLRWEDLYYARPNPRGYVMDYDFNDIFIGVAVAAYNSVPSPVDDDFATVHGRGLIDSVAMNDGLHAAGAAWVDDDGDAISFVLVSGVTNGTLNLNPSTGQFIYTPNSGFVGQDSFTYKLFDGTDYSMAIASVTLLVNNTPPVAVNDSFAVAANGRHVILVSDLLVNDTDEDGGPDPLDVVRGAGSGPLILGLPEHGSLEWLAGLGQLIYTPNPDYVGEDAFTYSVTDGDSQSSLATVTLDVRVQQTTVAVAVDYGDEVSVDESDFVEMTSDLYAVYALDVPFVVTAALAADASSSATVWVYNSASGDSVGSFQIAPGQIESRRYVLPILQNGSLPSSVGLIAFVNDSSTGQPIATDDEEEEIRQCDLDPCGEASVLATEAAAVYADLKLTSVTSSFLSSAISPEDREAAITAILERRQNELMTREQAAAEVESNIGALALGVKQAASESLTGGIDRILSSVGPRPRIMVGGRAPGAALFDALAGLLLQAKGLGLAEFLADPTTEDPTKPVFIVDLFQPEELFRDVAGDALLAALTGNQAGFLDSLRDKPVIQSLKARIPFSLGGFAGADPSATGSLNFELTNISIEGLRDSRLNFGFDLATPIQLPFLGMTITEFGFEGWIDRSGAQADTVLKAKF